MTMVEYSEMGDKQSQQRRRRADGAVRSVADRSAVEENRALAPQAAQTTQRWSSVDPEPPRTGRDFVDSAERGSLAGPAREIPASFDVLAAAERLGGAGHLVEHLANVSGRVKRAPAIEVERIVSGREFCPREKRGLRRRKNQAGQGDEVDGGGRRPRSSSGKLPPLCLPGGSPTRGNDARDDPGRTASSRGPSP